VIFHNLEQDSVEWKELRKRCIGASDAPIIMGVSPYTTPYQLWNDKVNGISKIENAAMTFGKNNEEAARELFEQMTGLTMFSRVVSHPERSWQIASLDGIDLDRSCILEIKCANANDHAMAKDGKVPDKYFPQLQHQMSVTNMNEEYYFSYHRGEGIIVKVKRDPEYIEKMIEMEKIFYFDHILTKLPPALTTQEIILLEIEKREAKSSMKNTYGRGRI
jgi:putative phage-type endonuclease